MTEVSRIPGDAVRRDPVPGYTVLCAAGVMATTVQPVCCLGGGISVLQ